MATECPMRMVESDGHGKWSSSRDTAVFTSSLKNMEVEELGMILKGHRLHGDQADMILNRSGSAPPSIEGSFAASRNLFSQENPSPTTGLASLGSISEERLLSDPTYLTYNCSNVNLNPRLTPPLISRENRHLVHHIGGLGDNWRSTSLDDGDDASSQFSQRSLSTHKQEPEDDWSPRKALNHWEENGAILLGNNKVLLKGQHKSLVDLIQEDFPRTPSPVYNQSRASGSHATAEELIDHDVHAISSNISSINISKVSESNLDSVDAHMDAHSMTLASDNDLSSSSDADRTRSSPIPQKDDRRTNDNGLDDDAGGVPQSDILRLDSIMSKKQEEQQSYGRNMPPQYPSAQQGIPYLVQGFQAQAISQGINDSHSLMEKAMHTHSRLSSSEVQSPLHSPALAPPLYATAAAYMSSGNPFYPNLQPSSLYTPQYSLGGYPLGSALLPPFMSGYQSHGTIPVAFDASSGPSYNTTAGISAGATLPHGGDMRHLGKFYGQHGLVLQTSFMDPLQMQYFQHPFGHTYDASARHAHLISNSVGGQPESYAQKESFTAFLRDQKTQLSTNGGVSLPSPRKVGVPGSSYYGGPTSMSVMAQFPASPLSSPLLPTSSMAGMNYLGRQNEMKFSLGPNRSAAAYSGWQGQRGISTIDDTKRHSFLEELKSSNSQKFELSDFTGRIVEFSVDQHGSRFIQQKLEHCKDEEKASVFKEVIQHALKLMTDVFGNYVIQKFFEYGSPEQRKELADQLVHQMLPLSLQMYGCRVIQKALEVIELDQKIQLVHELDGHVLRCVRDQNGNHVVQKCIEFVPTERIGFIISAFHGQVATLSTHPYGCRVIQRVLEHCPDEQQTLCIIDEILESACELAQDQYGNYVTQHVLERGKPKERCKIISKLTGKIVQMSQHKYASNVVEKCLEHADTAERELLVNEILGERDVNDNLLIMMKDQYANYVIQKILEISEDKQREILLNRVKVHLHALKKYTYGKHIVTRFEQLFGEESQASEPVG